MPHIIDKVTAFVTRPTSDGCELLLFEHPSAGIQIPAGTVEPEEARDVAVLREAAEETGLRALTIAQYLGALDEPPPVGHRLIGEQTTVYARPDSSSFDWAHLRRGLQVRLEREANGYSQVTYEEFDRIPNSRYVSYQITGWVPNQALAATFLPTCMPRADRRSLVGTGRVSSVHPVLGAARGFTRYHISAE